MSRRNRICALESVGRSSMLLLMPAVAGTGVLAVMVAGLAGELLRGAAAAAEGFTAGTGFRGVTAVGVGAFETGAVGGAACLASCGTGCADGGVAESGAAGGWGF